MPIFQNKCVCARVCIWILDQVFFFSLYFSAAIIGQVFGNTAITARLSLINQESQTLYVIFSFAKKWHQKKLQAPNFFSGKQEKKKKGVTMRQ